MNRSMNVSSRPGANANTVLLNRIKGEFLEMPGLQLTEWQAQRLWGLERSQCDAVLSV